MNGTEDDNREAGADPRAGPPDDEQAPEAPSGDAPTAATPLGTASLWMQYLQDPHHYRPELDALVVKRERWGNYARPAAIMRRLALTELPVIVSGRSVDVAYVRFVVSASPSSSSAAKAPEWFLTTVRGADGLWRVWDLTEDRRPPVWEIVG